MKSDAQRKESAAEMPTGKVGRKLFWMVLSGGVSIANSMVLWVFVARLRDVEELGRFTIVLGLYALFYNVCSLGLIPFFVSEISRRMNVKDEAAGSTAKDEQKIINFIGSASSFLLISGFICAVSMTICGFLVSQSWTVRLSTLVLSLAMIPTGVINVAEATAIALGRTRLMACVSTLENALRTVVPFALIWFGFDIAVICASFVGVRIVALLAYLWTVRRRLSRFAFSRIDFVKTLKVAPTFGSTIVLSSVNWQVVIILLASFSTEAESAKYGVASRFLVPVSILMASYASVFQPVFTQYAQKSIEKAGLYLSKMLSYPLILSSLAALASPFLSRHVLTALFGSEYAEASSTLDVLAISVVPFSVVMIVSRGLVATNYERIDLIANALGVAVCITSGSILVPRYGATGAAIAQLLSIFSMALLETVYLSKRIIGFRGWQKAGVSSVFLLTIYLFIWKL